MKQNRKEYQDVRAIEGFKYKNGRSDFAVIAEKNEKQYVRLQLSIPESQGAFSPLLMVTNDHNY